MARVREPFKLQRGGWSKQGNYRVPGKGNRDDFIVRLTGYFRYESEAARNGTCARYAGIAAIVTAAAVTPLFAVPCRTGAGFMLLHISHGPGVLYGVLHLGTVRFIVGCRDVRYCPGATQWRDCQCKRDNYQQ